MCAQIHENVMKFRPAIVNMRSADLNKFAWSRLQRYHNTEWVQKRLIEIHKIETKFHHFAINQAKDISFCIKQAKEYFKAASISDISVSPLLYYYGITSLSTALILFLKTGDFRIEKIREKFGSHGLKFYIDGNQKKSNISDFRIKEDGLGLYQLFRTSIGTDYVLGKEKNNFGSGVTTKTCIILEEEEIQYSNRIHDFSFAKLITLYPDFYWHVGKYDLSSDLVRVKIENIIDSGQDYNKLNLICQPSNVELIEKMSEYILCEPRGYPYLDISEFPSGYLASFKFPKDFEYMVKFPPLFRDFDGGLYASSSGVFIRQVCIIYLMSYFSGMYARYYPDLWSSNILKGDEVYLSIYDSCGIIENHFPIFILQELEFEMYYNDFGV
jgi:YaaC-like Protein